MIKICEFNGCDGFLKCNHCKYEVILNGKAKCGYLDSGASRRGKHNNCWTCKYKDIQYCKKESH